MALLNEASDARRRIGALVWHLAVADNQLKLKATARRLSHATNGYAHLITDWFPIKKLVRFGFNAPLSIYPSPVPAKSITPIIFHGIWIPNLGR